MSLLPLSRRKKRRCLTYAALVFGFLLMWCICTIAIVYVQEQLLGPATPPPRRPRDDYIGRGVQVVVGHYNGNLPQEKLRNLTDDELNANDFSPIGWGEGGGAVRLTDKEEAESDDTFGINQFSLYISNRIALNRTLPDMRKRECREKEYPDEASLPTTSVIIVYHNEAWSTLLRTVQSVIDRSPRPLIKEIILVDDKSTRTFLGKPLDAHVKSLPVRVKIIRAQQRVGLIRARLMGAQESTGDVLTFLDSHCECTQGWLQPLLARIKEDRKAVVCPVIDVINDRTFAYQRGIELFRGGFNWNLQFRWYSMPKSAQAERAKDPAAPIESPTMAGGLFSMSRTYFEELGTYDSGMDIWGGENLEMSFRIWQCGGRIEILPCSHVGHIFRKASPHDFPGKSSGAVLNGNLLRVAEVWMDDWKHLFYKTSPQALHLRSSVDVSERLELRKRLHCKSFRWYLDNVFTDHFMPLAGASFGRLSSDDRCLATRTGQGITKHKPVAERCTLGFNVWQLWLVTREGRVRCDEHLCLGASQSLQSKEWNVQLKECGEYDGEYWTYDRKRRRLTHRQSGQCLSALPAPKQLGEEMPSPTLAPCSRGTDQTWKLDPVAWRS